MAGDDVVVVIGAAVVVGGDVVVVIVAVLVAGGDMWLWLLELL